MRTRFGKRHGYQHEGLRKASGWLLILAGVSAFIGNLGDLTAVVNDHSKTTVLANTLNHLRYTVHHDPLNVGGWFLHVGIGTACAFLALLGIFRVWRTWDGPEWGLGLLGVFGIGATFTFIYGIIGYGNSVMNAGDEGHVRSSWVNANFGTNQAIPEPAESDKEGDDGHSQRIYYPATFSATPIGAHAKVYYKVAAVFNDDGSCVGLDLKPVSKAQAGKIHAAYLKEKDD
jgi:hypothetical protein